MSEYKETVIEEMIKLSNIKNSIFLGQQTASESFYGTLTKIPLEKRMEFPIAEELQLGFSIGMALEGYLPISIFQRMDFLPRCADQLINHLNLLPELSRGIFIPKVIIRTTIGSKTPLNSGLQHTQDLTLMFKSILKFPVLKVETPKEVKEAYDFAINSKLSTMIVEIAELY